jgi:Cys-tRNA(Pro)/Cys-tRNA(Cys) deacylase
VHEYAHDPGTDSYALEAASALSLDPDRVLKTLVMTADEGLIVCLIPAAASLDLRSLGKRASLAPVDRAESVTGYVEAASARSGRRAGCPPSSMKLRCDSAACSSAPVAADEMELAPQDLVTATGAAVRRLRRDPSGDAETHGRFPPGHPHQP